ncbi:MAG: CoA ester lyase [Pseudomonadota bacterium]
MRSWLFVPGDSERKIMKAADTGADILILDLEDSVAPERKPAARGLVFEALKSLERPVAVRINPLLQHDCILDLQVVMSAAPDIIVLPKSEGGHTVEALSARLCVAEAHAGLPEGVTQIMAIATETPAAMFGLGSYSLPNSRLQALSWGMEDLSAAIGAARTRTPDGVLGEPYALARSLCLFGAHAAKVAPLDTVFTAHSDEAGLIAECEAAAADGFLGKLAIHPAQVAAINTSFAPTAEALSEAAAIVEAFAQHPEAGVLSVNGEMVDRPHLLRAEALLRRAERFS